MGIDKNKMKTLEKLKETGFDTARKIQNLDAREIFRSSLTGELGNILDLQDAIRSNHSELSWLMDGTDPRPAKKDGKKDARQTAESAGSSDD